jgi:hypothetical protein
MESNYINKGQERGFKGTFLKFMAHKMFHARP